MKHEIFLKIDGIEGESIDPDHKNEIDVRTWNWQLTQESGMHAGSGGAGKVKVHDLIIEHAIDKASANLMKYCLIGKVIKEATLTMRKAGGKPFQFLKITMTDLVITQVTPSGSRLNEDDGGETVGMSFAKVKQEYIVQNDKGGSAGAVTAAYDIKLGKEA